MSRSRSQSPKRQAELPEAQPKKQNQKFPPIEIYIREQLGALSADATDWCEWRTDAKYFFKQYCHSDWIEGRWTYHGLLCFFAVAAYHRRGAWAELQLLLNSLTFGDHESKNTWELLKEVERIIESMRGIDRPTGEEWALGWSRILRHMNQRIPFVTFFPNGLRSFQPTFRYSDVFFEPDCYKSYSSTLANFTDQNLLSAVKESRSRPFPKFEDVRERELRAATSTMATVEEIIVRNFNQLMVAGVTFPSLGGASLGPRLKEALDARPGTYSVKETSVLQFNLE